MSDLIERFDASGVSDPDGCFVRYDEIERLTAENLDLELSRKFFKEYCDEKDERIAKLQAVVDAATAYLEFKEDSTRLQVALAALEDEYTIKIHGLPSKLEPPAEIDDDSL